MKSFAVLFFAAVLLLPGFGKAVCADKYVNPIGEDWITIDSADRELVPAEDWVNYYRYLVCSDSLNCLGMIDLGNMSHYLFRRTTDGGLTWENISVDSSDCMIYPHIMAMPDKNTALLLGDTGVVLRSTNGGYSWNAAKIPGFNAEKYWFNHLFMKGPIGIAQYGASDCYMTEDGGASWSKMEINVEPDLKYSISHLSILDSNNFIMWGIHHDYDKDSIVTGEFSCYYTTSDRGKTWNLFKMLPYDEDRYHKFTFFNSKMGFSSYQTTRKKTSDQEYDTVTTYIYKTHDGGNAWNEIFRDINPYYGYQTVFFDSLHAIGRDNYGKCIITSDGGYNWKKTDWVKYENNQYGYYSLATAYLTPETPLITNGVKVLKYVGKNKSIRDAAPPSETIFISPNPASEFISITPSPTGVKAPIEIYSNLGLLALSSPNEAGRIDVARLPAGVYFIKIGTQVAKFVKI